MAGNRWRILNFTISAATVAGSPCRTIPMGCEELRQVWAARKASDMHARQMGNPQLQGVSLREAVVRRRSKNPGRIPSPRFNHPYRGRLQIRVCDYPRRISLPSNWMRMR